MTESLLLEHIRVNLNRKIDSFRIAHASNTTLDIGVRAGLKYCEVELEKIINTELEKLKTS